ncbi:hypothetical protein [Lentilactobacillus farraginis]|uniref:Uncharacterized protein n=1 Tax=Lentilactobacillus farraginis DSM 18382 = JCM 14108 TaxID=1423743 RepID=X0PBF4_9LACO|nr:hypothetical protein [Lentilactobacillus farraginis]KRM03964.1 hypothetical protein FD41_GL001004 [Lentilactobacillus farraginis DSM 18382 = JCM 14108]GAF37163.1 hypothetical protein JCM14108_2178 [Lentilactobacillus farraginis DSM 18382 = JCM 14108]
MDQDRQAILDAASHLGDAVGSEKLPVDHFTFVSIVSRMALHDSDLKKRLLAGFPQADLPTLFEHIETDVANQERINQIRKEARLRETDDYVIKRQVTEYGKNLGWPGLRMNDVFAELDNENIPPRDQQTYWGIYENDYCVTFHGKVVAYKSTVLDYLKKNVKFILAEKKEKVDERELLRRWQETFNSAKRMYRKKHGFTPAVKKQLQGELNDILNNIPTVEDD